MGKERGGWRGEMVREGDGEGMGDRVKERSGREKEEGGGEKDKDTKIEEKGK